jgi:hypothetical protein
LKLFLTSLSGIFVPGLGHLILGRRAKGLTFLAVLTLLFLVGISMDPDYFQKFGPGMFGPSKLLPSGEWAGPDGHEGFVDSASRILFTYVFPFCVGLADYFLGYVLQPILWAFYQSLGFVGKASEAPVAVKDVGYCFAQLAGLLNLLVMMDAYDCGYNDALFEKQYGEEKDFP